MLKPWYSKAAQGLFQQPPSLASQLRQPGLLQQLQHGASMLLLQGLPQQRQVSYIHAAVILFAGTNYVICPLLFAICFVVANTSKYSCCNLV